MTEILNLFVTPPWDKTRLGRVCDDLGAVLQMQMIQDFSHVILDRPFGDADGDSHLTVGLALCDQRQDLQLPGRERDALRLVCACLARQSGCDCAGWVSGLTA